MTSLQAATIWIAFNGIFLVLISAHVGHKRLKYKVNLGDGGNDAVQCAVRAQGNYIEYAPIALIGLLALAMNGAGANVVHFFGASFLAMRVAHFAGLGLGVWPTGRTVGTMGTMLTLLLTSIALLYFVFV